MSSIIFFKDQDVQCSNGGLAALIAWSLEVGADMASTKYQFRECNRLSTMHANGEFWRGRDLDIEDVYPEVEQQKFWSIVFNEIAERIFRREIGHQEQQDWQAWMIYKAISVSRLFVEAVHGCEPRWHPGSEEIHVVTVSRDDEH